MIKLLSAYAEETQQFAEENKLLKKTINEAKFTENKLREVNENLINTIHDYEKERQILGDKLEKLHYEKSSLEKSNRML